MNAYVSTDRDVMIATYCLVHHLPLLPPTETLDSMAHTLGPVALQ